MVSRREYQHMEDKWLKRGVIGGLANFNEPAKAVELMDHEKNQQKGQTLHQFDKHSAHEILAILLMTQSTQDQPI